jgi:two-component system chemotaxis response regulator CheY
MLNKTSDYLGPFKILVVEPNPLMRRITRGVLQLLGARRIIETDSINAAAAYIQQGDVDVVLSEWYLTASYGVDLIRWLRRSESDIRFTPFIMMTSQTRLESVTAARNAGITEFVAKPFSAKSLIARIREVVERPRPFVAIGQYFGPDRRRRAGVLEENTDRRSAGALLIGGTDLTQDQINRVVSGNGRP